jgi:hypothetical protein
VVAMLRLPIHRSAWKDDSLRFALVEFWEVCCRVALAYEICYTLPEAIG